MSESDRQKEGYRSICNDGSGWRLLLITIGLVLKLGALRCLGKGEAFEGSRNAEQGLPVEPGENHSQDV